VKIGCMDGRSGRGSAGSGTWPWIGSEPWGIGWWSTDSGPSAPGRTGV